MNWQTKEIIDETKEAINDEAVFSPDQISLLMRLIQGFEQALEKESRCLESGISFSGGGHGFGR